MSQFYFLISSLPYLLPGGDPNLTHEDFLDLSRPHLSDSEWEVLKACRLRPDNNSIGLHPVLDSWIRWESSLRNEMVLLRAHKLKQEPEKWTRDNDGPAGLFETVREAVHQDNPLEAERILDQARLSYLDELEVARFFDFTALLVYSLKLQILNRRGLFVSEKGEAEYRRVYETVLGQIQQAEV